MKYVKFRCSFLAIAVLASACSTPSSVRELAEQSAAKTTLIAKDAKALASDRRKLAEERAGRIGRIQQLANANTLFIEEEVAVYKAAGSTAAPQLYQTMVNLVSSIDTIDQSRTDPDAVKDAVLQSNTRIEIDASAALEASKAMAKLAEDDNGIAFIAEFSRAVYNDIKDRTEEAKTAAEKGDNVADDATTTLEADAEDAAANLTINPS